MTPISMYLILFEFAQTFESLISNWAIDIVSRLVFQISKSLFIGTDTYPDNKEIDVCEQCRIKSGFPITSQILLISDPLFRTQGSIS